jgi:hypothetical protein
LILALATFFLILLGAFALRMRLRRHPGGWYEASAPPLSGDTAVLFASLQELVRTPLARLFFGQAPLALVLRTGGRGIACHLWVSRRDQTRVLAILEWLGRDWLGREITLKPVGDARPEGPVVASARARLKAHRYLPIDRDGCGDLRSLLDVLAQAGTRQDLAVELWLLPKGDHWQGRARRRARGLRDGHTGHWPFTRAVPGPLGDVLGRAVESKASMCAFDAQILLAASAPSFARARTLVELAGTALAEGSASFNALDFGHVSRRRRRPRDGPRRFPFRRSLLFTVSELASLWRLPPSETIPVDQVAAALGTGVPRVEGPAIDAVAPAPSAEPAAQPSGESVGVGPLPK